MFLILIILFAIGFFILSIIDIIKKRFSLTRVVEYLTIYGVLFGIGLYFDLSPQRVKITKEKEIRIGSIEAIKNLHRKGRAASIYNHYPKFLFSAYITNTGDLPITDPVLQFKFINVPKGFEYSYQPFKVFVYEGVNTSIKNPSKQPWKSDTLGHYNTYRYEKENYYGISLPPLLSGKTQSIIVGYYPSNYAYSDDLLDTIVNGIVNIRILEKGEIDPDWNRDGSALTKNDKIYDTKNVKFRSLSGYFGGGSF